MKALDTVRRQFPLVRSIAVLAMAAMCFVLCAPAAVQAQTESVEYYGVDALGSVRVVFDANGNVIGRMDYGPFGSELAPTHQKQSDVYAGLSVDNEAGLSDADFRSYQVRTGRFTTVDPVYTGLFEPQRWNRYTYALNGAATFSDSTGLNVFRGESTPGCSTFPDDKYCNPLQNWMDWWWAFGSWAGGSGSSYNPDYGNVGGGSGLPLDTQSVPPNPSEPPAGPPIPGPTPPGPPTPPPPPPGREPSLQERLRCAATAANEISIASFVGATGFWGQAILGNDIATASNLLTGPGRAGPVGSALASNPTPINLVTMTGTLVADSITYGAPRATLGFSGAGTAFVKGFSKTTLLEGLTAAGVTGALGAVQAVKLGYDLGTFVGAYIGCGS